MKQFFLPLASPQINASAFVAEGAVVVGAVTIGAQASIWYQCVLRGDINRIVVGDRSNVQDGVVIHVADDFPAVLGADVSVGHCAIIHACEIGDGSLVGMGAIVMDGVVIGPRCVIGAGAVVTKNFKAPEGSLILGSPAKIVRQLSPEEREKNVTLAAKYVEVSRRYREIPDLKALPRG